MNILIVKTSSLGDIVQTFSCLPWLKANIPECRISWMVEKPFASLLKAHPLVDHVFEVETKLWRKGKNLKSFWDFKNSLQASPQDIAFDLQGNFKSGLLLAFVKAKKKVGYGWSFAPEKINLFFTNYKISPEKGLPKRAFYLSILKAFFAKDLPFSSHISLKLSENEKKELEALKKEIILSKKPIFIGFGSFWKNKKVPHMFWKKHFQDVESLFTTYGTKEEKHEAELLKCLLPKLNILPKMPLSVLQNLFPYFHKVYAVDSVLLHLAGTTGVETIGIFGPSSAAIYAPDPKSAIQGTCPFNISFNERCPKLRTCKTGACMHQLTI